MCHMRLLPSSTPSPMRPGVAAARPDSDTLRLTVGTGSNTRALLLQRAVEDEVTAFLGRARYQRTPEAAGSRNGTRPKPIQTAEGEISVDMPQVRGTAAHFISRVFPDSRTVIRTRPLEALIIGGYVRGLSDRDIESLLQEAGLGQVSKSTASRICREIGRA